MDQHSLRLPEIYCRGRNKGTRASGFGSAPGAPWYIDNGQPPPLQPPRKQEHVQAAGATGLFGSQRQLGPNRGIKEG